jgi:DNA replication protein DnaC
MINEVLEQLTYLKLKSAYTYLKELHINDQISASELKGLYKVLNKEVIAKDENNKLYKVKVAGFPFLRKLDDYDFSFQPTVSEDKIRAIGASNFYDEGTNIVFIGNPDVGKTHLAISIGYEVAIKRNSVYFH